MRIPGRLLQALRRRAWFIVSDRPADMVIGPKDNPYLLRWHLIPRNRFVNLYLHSFLRSDDDRALHDHPWASASICLVGRYADVTQERKRLVQEGDIVFRRASHAHRVELLAFTSHPDGGLIEEGAMTLFLTGPKIREWGFHCPQGWRHWRDYVKLTPGGNERGAGCE